MAVHIEVCSELSSEVFVATFRRFCAIHDLTTEAHLGSGTNFVSAANAIRETHKFLEHSDL